MTKYQITIDWTNDYVIADAIKAEMRKLLHQLRNAKKDEDEVGIRLIRKDLKELSDVLKQIRAHKDLIFSRV